VKEDIKYVVGEKLTPSTVSIKVVGYSGTWYVINTKVHNGTNVFLLEHEQRGDEASCLIADENCYVLRDEVWNGFDDLEIADESSTIAETNTNDTTSSDESVDKMHIDLGFANLVVEKYDGDSSMHEFVIMLVDKETGLAIQDIALVRQAINANNGEIIPEAVDCIVWADSGAEDYTDKFFINCYKPD